jgi:hypothetical protein
MARDQLPQSVQIVQFFASLGGGAVVIWVVWELVAEPLDYVGANATGLVATSNEWFDILIQNLPIAFVFIAAMGSIAWTVFATRFG